MQDMIIKGTGNSRYLKSVANAMNLYPTYEDFIAALVAGTFPIDLNGVNPSGVEQAGTALNKANILADATATGMGLTAAATPNDAFSKLRQLVNTAQSTANEKSMIQTGSFTSRGSVNQTLYFYFPWQFFVYGSKISLGYTVKGTDSMADYIHQGLMQYTHTDYSLTFNFYNYISSSSSLTTTYYIAIG